MGLLLSIIVEALLDFAEDVEADELAGGFKRVAGKGAKFLGEFLNPRTKGLKAFTNPTKWGKLARYYKDYPTRAFKAFSKSKLKSLEKKFSASANEWFGIRAEERIAKLESLLNDKTINVKLRTKLRTKLNNLLEERRKSFERRLDIDLKGFQILSSSWLKIGLLARPSELSPVGLLFLITWKGNTFLINDCPLSVWYAMVKAYGTHGSGAGSVLWDTLWQGKRTKSLKTGGVLKNRQLRLARRARTIKRTKYFERQYQKPREAKEMIAWHSVKRLKRDFKRKSATLGSFIRKM